MRQLKSTNENNRLVLLHALYKYRKFWKNRFISTRHKIAIYNVYVKSISKFKCSTWVASKSTNDILEAFHRKDLRHVLNIHCPKFIKTEECYIIINQSKTSDENANRRLIRRSYMLRKNHPTRNFSHLITLKAVNCSEEG